MLAAAVVALRSVDWQEPLDWLAAHGALVRLWQHRDAVTAHGDVAAVQGHYLPRVGQANHTRLIPVSFSLLPPDPATPQGHAADLVKVSLSLLLLQVLGGHPPNHKADQARCHDAQDDGENLEGGALGLELFDELVFA